MPTLSVKLIFHKSHSKFYPRAIKLASNFDHFERGEVNSVYIEQKELYEKWESFNLLFWKVVDWKGTILEYDGMQYHDHSPKTRIFYAVQLAKQVHVCDVIWRIKNIRSYKVTKLEFLTMCN